MVFTPILFVGNGRPSPRAPLPEGEGRIHVWVAGILTYEGRHEIVEGDTLSRACRMGDRHGVERSCGMQMILALAKRARYTPFGRGESILNRGHGLGR